MTESLDFPSFMDIQRICEIRNSDEGTFNPVYVCAAIVDVASRLDATFCENALERLASKLPSAFASFVLDGNSRFYFFAETVVIRRKE